MGFRWGVAVSTRNRPDDLVTLVESIAGQAIRPAAVAIVDQGALLANVRDRIDRIAAAAGFPVLWDAGGTGLSAGRNRAFRLLADHAEWAVTPNDTSTLDADFSTALARAAAAAAEATVLAGTYAFEGTPIRDPGPAGRQLAGWELWAPIEPACAWRIGPLIACGGFDERIGTGSPGAAQSGEGTDLLVRLTRLGPVRTAPEMVVHGRPHGFGLSRSAWAAKDYGYAVGTGLIYRRHYPGMKAYLRLAWPAVQGVLHAARRRDPAELRYGVARTRGRMYGYFRSDRALRPRAGANPSDRWRSA